MPHTIVTPQVPLRSGIHVHQALYAEKEWTDQDRTRQHLMAHRPVNVHQGMNAELELLKVIPLMFNAHLVHTMMSQAQRNVSTAHPAHIAMVVRIDPTVTLAITVLSTQTLQIQQIAIWVMNVTPITTVKVVLVNNFLVSMELGVIRQDSLLVKYARKASSVPVGLRKYVLTIDTAMEPDLITSLDSFARMERMELKLTQILDTDSMAQKIAQLVQLENSAQLVESLMIVLLDTCVFKMPTNTPLTQRIQTEMHKMLIHAPSDIIVKKVPKHLSFVLQELSHLKKEE